MAIRHTKTSAVADSGDTSLVQPSDWNADHTLDGDGLELTRAASFAAAPTGKVRLVATSQPDRLPVGVVDAQGNYRELQTARRLSPVIVVSAVSGANVLNSVGTVLTNLGTLTARTIGSADHLNAMTRTGIVSAATAGSLAASRQNFQCVRGNVGTVFGGGYHYSCKFGISDAATVAGARMFVGVQNSVAAPTNVEPSTLVNSIGIAQLSTDSTQLYLCYGGTAAQTPIACGTNFPVTAGIAYSLEIMQPYYETATFYVRLLRLDTGDLFSQDIVGTSVTVPTVGLTHQLWRTNNATALAVGIDHGGLNIEKEF